MALGRRGACGRVGAAVRRVGRRMGGVRKAAAARREAAKAAVGKCKRAIVRKARQCKARVHSRRTQRYLLACSQRGVAPGWLEGVDGPGW
jgi:hypothetical protein